MTLVEFLNVFNGISFEQQNPDRVLTEETSHLKDYNVPRRIILRSLIFNNPYIDEIYSSSSDPWTEWCERFIADNQTEQVDKDNVRLKLKDLNILKSLFKSRDDRTSFENFVKVVRLIRQSGINLNSQKRWTSKFVFPWGKHCLFAELERSGSWSDRRFFGRNGELLFMMLCFADRREELSEKINTVLLNSGDEYDAICEALTFGEDGFVCIPGKNCELPVDFFDNSRRRINIICDDLIDVLSLPIPAPDIVQHASRLLSLNLLCYYLEQSFAVLQKYTPDGDKLVRTPLLCEALQKESSDIRRISKRFFDMNEKMSRMAVHAYYNANIDAPEAYKLEELAEGETLELTAQEEEEEEGKGDSLRAIGTNHDRHWGALHKMFGKDCGLSTDMFTRGARYAPSDDLLETLAATLIPKRRMLFSTFLQEAYDRYGLVFGEVEFQRTGVKIPDLIPDNNVLKENRRRLKNRFNSLGLLVSLSDGFEYILNPYRN